VPSAFVEVLGCVSVFPVEEGQRHQLDSNEPFRINRMTGDLSLPHARVSRKHARLESIKGIWCAIDESSTNGTLVNGRNANPPIPLQQGDIIDIAGVLLLRFGTPPPRNATMENAIADEPADEGRWRVWQDWLLEQNDPVGQWMNARERTMTERAASLGPLAKGFKGRELSCTWNRLGFVSHLTMQFHSLGDLPNALWLLRHLDDVPAARFITSLTLELLPIALRDQTPPAVTLIEALAVAALPRSLRHLHLAGHLPTTPGPGFRSMTERPPPKQIDAALAHLRRSSPYLETTERSLITWQVAPAQ